MSRSFENMVVPDTIFLGSCGDGDSDRLFSVRSSPELTSSSVDIVLLFSFAGNGCDRLTIVFRNEFKGTDGLRPYGWMTFLDDLDLVPSIPKIDFVTQYSSLPSTKEMGRKCEGN